MRCPLFFLDFLFVTVLQRGEDWTGLADCHLLGQIGERVDFDQVLDGSSSRYVMILTMSLKVTFLGILCCVKAVFLFNTKGFRSPLFLIVRLRAITPQYRPASQVLKRLYNLQASFGSSFVAAFS